MYVELTPDDTLRDLQTLLIDAIPGFEFPRKNLFDYTINTIEKSKDELDDNDFVLGVIWHEIEGDEAMTLDDMVDGSENGKYVLVDDSCFNMDLTSEEINILAILMMINWVQRQVTSIENTRMKYSGTDFKMTSQANHLSKLLSLLSECQRQSHHMQRLYKRRRINSDTNTYESNWDIFGRGKYYDRKIWF